MPSIDISSGHKTKKFSRSRYQPESKIDLHNPAPAKQANEEVIAFLKWLDQKQNNEEALRELNKDH
jgi:DNA-nicking Smr family endonuclease